MLKLKILFLYTLTVSIIGVSSYGQPIELDKKIGKNNFDKVVKLYGLYNDSSMTAYLNKVGQRLVSNLDTALFSYKFFIIDDATPNAFALPGGYIFITRGIIPILENEDELAGIIGHEIIHSNNRHTVRQLRKKILPTLVVLPATIATAIVPSISMVTRPIINEQKELFAKYSRKFETEADEQGVILSSKAGYKPLALSIVLDRLMQSIQYITGEKEKRSYFADHPYTLDREQNIKTIASQIESKKIEPISKSFVSEFDGILIGNNHEKGVIKDNIFLQAEKDYFVEFPNSWKIENHDPIVVGYSFHKDAIIKLRIEDTLMQAKKAADKYLLSITDEHKQLLVKSETFKINSVESYILRFEEVNLEDTIFANIIWLPVDDKLFKISTISDIKNNVTILNVLNSIRQLNSTEFQSIKMQHIKIVKAKKGETITDLSKRTDNTIKPYLTAIINACKLDTVLEENQEIKIVLETSYSKKL